MTARQLLSAIGSMKKCEFIKKMSLAIHQPNFLFKLILDVNRNEIAQERNCIDNFHRIFSETLSLYHQIVIDMTDFEVHLESTKEIDRFCTVRADCVGWGMKGLRYKGKEDFLTHKNIAVGGTFDRFHYGHLLLLTMACVLCDGTVHIGITSDDYIKDKYLSDIIQPYDARKQKVEDFINKFQVNYLITPLNDAADDAASSNDLTALVLTSETEGSIDLIESKRKSNNLPSLSYYVIDNLIAPNSLLTEIRKMDKLSSSLLRFNELGKLRKPPNIPCSYERDLLGDGANEGNQIPYLIGVTGCIASGKSSICKLFQQRVKAYGNWSVTLIDCDKLAHESYRYGKPCYYELLECFSDDSNIIINPKTNEIDRSSLGKIVFNDDNKRDLLNKIVWKHVLQLMVEEIKTCGSDICLVEAAFMIEAGRESLFNEIWVTWVNEKEAISRIMARNNSVNEELARKKFVASQQLMTNKQKIQHAHVLISTIHSKETTEKIIDKICSEHKSSTMLYPYGSWKVYKIHSNDSTESQPHSSLPNDEIVDIKYSRGKNYLAVLTKTMFTIWRTKPRMQIMNLTRDHAFIETFGFHLSMVWKLDATMSVIMTDEGWVLLYRIMINTNEKLYRPSFDSLDVDGYQPIFLQLVTMFRLPALPTSIISRKESFLISTNQGTIEAMAWPSNDSLIHHNTSSIRSTSSDQNDDTCSNVCIISMDTTPWIGYIGFVFDSGKCGLIHIPVGHIDSIFGDARYNFIFIDNVEDATKICINSRFQFITIGCKSGQIKSFRFDDKTQTISYSHSNNVANRPSNISNVNFKNMGAVKSLCWCSDFTILASCWEYGHIALWTTFGSLINFVSLGNTLLGGSSYKINNMDWGIDSYSLTVHVSFEDTHSIQANNKQFYELSFVKFDQTVSDLVFLHGFNYVLVSQMKKMSHYQGKYQKKHNISHNSWFVLNLPDLYQLHDSHIKNVVVDVKSLNIAVACDKGYLVYNWDSQKWLNSTLNRHPSETLVNSLCVNWWEGVLLMSIFHSHNPTNSSLMCHIINYKTNDNIKIVKEFDYASVFQQIDPNNKLIVFGMDSNVHIYELEMIYDSSDNLLKKNVLLLEEKIISLVDIVPHPLTLIDLKFHPEFLSNSCSPGHNSKPDNGCTQDKDQSKSPISLNLACTSKSVEYFLVNISGNLYSVMLTDSNNVNKEQCQIIKSYVESFWTLEYFMWYFCGWKGVQLYVPKNGEDSLPTDTLVSLNGVSIHVNLPNTFLYPIKFNTDTMLIHAIECDVESETYQPIYKLNNITTLLMPDILLDLIFNGYENEAIQLIQNPMLTIENVIHNLEILLHNVLVGDYATKTRSSEDIIDVVVKFIKNFPEYHEVFCYCTRKIEMKLWPKMFSVVGSPEKLFLDFIQTQKFSVASSYLVVINNVESVSVNKKLYNLLLVELINHKKWKILRDVFNYIKTTCESFEYANDADSTPRSRSASFHTYSGAKPREFIRSSMLDMSVDDIYNQNIPMALHQSFDNDDDINDIDFFRGIVIRKADPFLSNADILSLSYMLQASYINIKSYVLKKKSEFTQLVSNPERLHDTFSKLVRIFSDFVQYYEMKHQNRNMISSIMSEKTYKSQLSQIKALHKIFCECQLYKWATFFTILNYDDNIDFLNKNLAVLKDIPENSFKAPELNYSDVAEIIVVTIDKLLQAGNLLSYRSRLWNNAITLKVNFMPKCLSYNTSMSDDLDSSAVVRPVSGGLLKASVNSVPMFELDGNSDNLNFSKISLSATNNPMVTVDEQIHADDNSLLASASIDDANVSGKGDDAAPTAESLNDSQGKCRIS